MSTQPNVAWRVRAYDDGACEAVITMTGSLEWARTEVQRMYVKLEAHDELVALVKAYRENLHHPNRDAGPELDERARAILAKVQA